MATATPPLSQRILTELSKVLILTTSEIIDRCASETPNARKRVWSVLLWLEKNGLVANIGRNPNLRHPEPTRWVLAK